MKVRASLSGWVLFLCLAVSPISLRADDQTPIKAQGGSRAPASSSPVWVGGQKDPLSDLKSPRLSVPRQPSRWRLMGTCRQDIGMNQSVSGFGYGNCNN